jgi:Rrf2 family transcriptional regulator, iron-sulfur cluster assembly transcription factor
MFSKACEYGIRAMIYIAHKSGEAERVGIKDIAKSVDSPEAFLAKILQDLSRKGLVQSVKGPNGGFFLEKKGLQVSLADVVSAIDGDQLFNGCGLGLKVCSEKNPCPIHDEFKAIRNKLKALLENTRVSEFTEDLSRGLLHLRRG